MAKNFKAWPKGWPKSLNYPDIPVFAFLDHTAARVPDRIAIIFEGMELTFAELKALSDRFATALAALGVRKGDRIAIHLPNCPQFAIAYYGILKIGGIFTPLSPLLAPREVLYQLNDSGTETLISLDTLFPGIASIVEETGLKRIITTSIADCLNAFNASLEPLAKVEIPNTLDMVSLLQQYEPDVRKISIDVRKDLAHLSYTGGTTGLSKCVMLTHRNVVVNVFQIGNWFRGAQIEMVDGTPIYVYPQGVDPQKDRLIAKDRETALVVVPWFHALGIISYLNNMINSGTTMVVFPRFDAKEYINAITKYKASILGGPPQLYISLVNLPDFNSYDLSSIKIATSGAAPLSTTVLEKMLCAFSGVVCEAYGLTECTMGATANPPDRSSIRPGSIGLPFFDTECKVVDPDTHKELPPGAIGEICIRGPQVMVGYWNKPEETLKDLKDGWLFTGDLGWEDEDGYFYITDRKKDMIIYKGYNVYPREIEEVIFEHPGVQQCAVVGKPDMEETGELPVAFVELKKGTWASRDEILEHINSKIAHYKKVRDVVFLETIPVSAAGKVLKRKLKEQLSQE